MRSRIWVVTVLAVVAAGLGVAPATSQEEAVCHPELETPGGDWRHFGGDVSSTRNQTQNTTIGVDNVANLEVAWTYTNGAGAGYITSTVVAGDCAYFTDEPAFGSNYVYAINVNTGTLVWKMPALPDIEPSATRGGGGWGGRSAPTVVDGVVHVNVTRNGEEGNSGQASAFDAATGERLWASEPIEFGYTTNNLSGPGVWDNVHFIATIGPDIDRNAREGFALLDATTGATLHKRTTVPPEDYARGYVGGGMWTSPAIDPATGYLYIATDNPNMSENEHPYSNAILKIDIARQRDAAGNPITGQTVITNPEFGEVSNSYKGEYDNYPVDPIGGYANPVCTTFSDPGNGGGWAPFPCGQVDVDFGASPTLIPHTNGLLVAASQKSGYFHVVRTDDMNRRWAKRMTYPFAYQGNSGPPANDGTRVFEVANPGVVFAYDAWTGTQLWATPVSDGGLSHHPLTYSNGVVYIIANTGHLYALDAADGAILTVRDLRQDSGVNCPAWDNAEQYVLFGPLAWSSGVTVANNMVIATCDAGPSADGSAVVAYHLGSGGGGGVPVPGIPELPEVPEVGVPGATMVVASGPGSSQSLTPAFLPQELSMIRGTALTYVSADPLTGDAPHQIVSEPRGLFQSGSVLIGQSPVAGVETLQPGTYQYVCSFHPSMRGSLTIM